MNTLALVLMAYINTHTNVVNLHQGEPISRESESYYATETSAEFALKHSTWTQRSHP